MYKQSIRTFFTTSKNLQQLVKPKKPATSYAIFFKNIRPELTRKYPNATFGELSKLGGIAWKQMNAEEKEPYIKEYQKENSKYLEAKANYKSSLPPKKPGNIYIQFANYYRPILVKEQPGLSIAEYGKLLGNKWNSLSDEEKSKYKQEYQEKLNQWKQENSLQIKI